jgi:hypothetical protein
MNLLTPKSTLFVLMCAIALLLTAPSAKAQNNTSCDNNPKCGVTPYYTSTEQADTYPSDVGTLCGPIGTYCNALTSPPSTSKQVGLQAKCQPPLATTQISTTVLVTNPCSYNVQNFMNTWQATTKSYLNAYGQTDNNHSGQVYQWSEAADCNVAPNGGNGFFNSPNTPGYGC